MANTQEIKDRLLAGDYEKQIRELYVDEALVPVQTLRYVKAIETFEEMYQGGEVMIFSAPGRSEVGGNHTDHQHGEILAASINLDAIAVVKKQENVVTVKSDDYPEITIDLLDLCYRKEEQETTKALIKGVLKGIQDRGFCIGGFCAYVTSDVLIGAGLSSSAAFESLMGTVLSYLYNEGRISPIEIAIIGQYAENVYFGKPCGLMDQMACSVGSLVHVNFADPKNPVVDKVEFDMNSYGYSLCITDTKGSHVDLTADYAAVPKEMRSVAACFGKEVLLGITIEDICKNITELRKTCGDRAVLRAIHFIEENERVQKEVDALRRGDLEEFLYQVQTSGNSSFRFLQNVYSNSDITHQNVSLALAISEITLKNAGVCRVHGGGFAGTIQAFVQNDAVKAYVSAMEGLFGPGCCHVLQIRKAGGTCVIK